MASVLLLKGLSTASALTATKLAMKKMQDTFDMRTSYQYSGSVNTLCIGRSVIMKELTILITMANGPYSQSLFGNPILYASLAILLNLLFLSLSLETNFLRRLILASFVFHPELLVVSRKTGSTVYIFEVGRGDVIWDLKMAVEDS